MTLSSKVRNPLLLTTCALVGLLTVGCSTGDNGGSSDTPDASGNTTAPAGDSCDFAPDFPSGPIEITVPFAAGGGSDLISRAVADPLGQALGTQINVVNRTGGGGVVGSQHLANAKPDGTTFGFFSPESIMSHHMGLSELSSESFVPLSQIAQDGAGITVSADSPFNSVQEVLDYAAENPGELTASGTGTGGSWHIALVGLLLDQGLPANAIEWVPSEGAAPALQEVVAGGIDISAASLGENRTMLETGRVKALGVMAEARVDGIDTETLEEQGIDYIGGAWRGFALPVGIDENIVKELDCEIKKIVDTAEFQEFMNTSGISVRYRDHVEFAEFAQEQDENLGVIIEAAGLAG